eukprot:jgi/Mesen1/6249/ME000323S05384
MCRQDVPWNRLGKEPVTVHLDRIFILAESATHEQPGDDETGDALQAAKIRKVRDAEVSNVEKDKNGGSQSTDPNSETWISALISTIIGNLQLSITNVHIRYEDSQSHPGHPLAAGVILEKLEAMTVDEQGRETFVTSGALDRAVNLHRLAVYFATDREPWKIQKPWPELEPEEWSRVFEPSIKDAFDELSPTESPSSDRMRERAYILQPVSGLAHYFRLGRNDPQLANQPRQHIEVKLDAVALALSEVKLAAVVLAHSKPQYRDLMKTVENLTSFNKRLEYLQYRPSQPVHGNTAAWWQFAYRATLQRHGTRAKDNKMAEAVAVTYTNKPLEGNVDWALAMRASACYITARRTRAVNDRARGPGAFLYLLASPLARSYKQRFSLLGKHVLEVAPEAIGGVPYVLAISDSSRQHTNVAETVGALLLKFEDEGSRNSWKRYLSSATFRASALPIAALLGGSNKDEGDKHEAGSEVFLVGILDKLSVTLSGVMHPYSGPLLLQPEEPVLNFQAKNGKVEFGLLQDSDLLLGFAVESLDIEDLLTGYMGATCQYLARSYLVSPGLSTAEINSLVRTDSSPVPATAAGGDDDDNKRAPPPPPEDGRVPSPSPFPSPLSMHQGYYAGGAQSHSNDRTPPHSGPLSRRTSGVNGVPPRSDSTGLGGAYASGISRRSSGVYYDAADELPSLDALAAAALARGGGLSQGQSQAPSPSLSRTGSSSNGGWADITADAPAQESPESQQKSKEHKGKKGENWENGEKGGDGEKGGHGEEGETREKGGEGEGKEKGKGRQEGERKEEEEDDEQEERDEKGGSVQQQQVVKGVLGRGKRRVLFKLVMEMENAQLTLNREDGLQLAMLTMEKIRVDIRVFPATFGIRADMGNLRICDFSLGEGHPFGWMCETRDQHSAKSFVQLEFNSFSKDDEDYKGIDYHLTAQLARVRIVVLYRFIQEITQYFLGLAPQGESQPVKLSRGISEVESFFTQSEVAGQPAVKLDLSFSNPVVVLPRSSHDKE